MTVVHVVLWLALFWASLTVQYLIYLGRRHHEPSADGRHDVRSDRGRRLPDRLARPWRP